MIELDIRKTLQGSGGPMVLDVTLKIEEHSFVALAGPSGSGKTTLLRILSGLETAEGVIRVGGETWLEGKKALPPQRRGIGFVFQDYALFENMSVEQNLLFVKDDRELAAHLLEMTGMTELRTRLPHSLSGGQKQRVSLCRAMMNRPKLLLLDEPLSARSCSTRSSPCTGSSARRRSWSATTPARFTALPRGSSSSNTAASSATARPKRR